MNFILHPGLRGLLRLRFRAAIRGLRRNLKTPARAVLFVLGMTLFALWMGSILFAGFAAPNRGDAAWFQDAAPFFILAMLVLSLVTSAGERAIYFSPSEIDFLFGGPFTRRQLLAYKFVGSAIGITFSAIVFSVIMSRYVPAWGPTFVGVWLALAFVQFTTMGVLLVSQRVAESAVTRARRTLLIAVGVMAALSLWWASYRVGARTAPEIIQVLRDDTLLRFVLWPVEPFVRVMYADPFWPTGVIWASVGLAMNVGICAFVLWMDAEYRESAIDVSQRWYARIQRARQTGVAPSSNTKAWGHAPRLPFWGGIGPIARRQLTTALRNSRALLWVTVIVAIGLAISLFDESRSPEQVWTMLYALTAWLTILLTMMMRFDFRSDLDQIESLKALPIRAPAIAAGQLLIPVAACLILQVIVFVAGASLIGRPMIAVAAAMFVIPVNILLFGIENVIFLLFPSRTMAFNPGDFQAMGRQMLLMLVKFGVLGIAAAFATVIGAIAFALSDDSLWIAAAAAWVVLAVQAALVFPAMAWAFNRFDVSADLPA